MKRILSKPMSIKNTYFAVKSKPNTKVLLETLGHTPEKYRTDAQQKAVDAWKTNLHKK